MMTLKRNREAVARRKFVNTGPIAGAGVLAASTACTRDGCGNSRESSCPDAGHEPASCPDAGRTNGADAGKPDASVEGGMLVDSEKKIPILAEAEVVVVGGGPSGIGTALAAARNGAETVSIEHVSFAAG